MNLKNRLLPFYYNSLVIFMLFFFIAGKIHAGDKIVVGYYPSWFKSKLPAEKIQFDNLTHINHAFAWPDEDGHIKRSSDLIYPDLNQLAHDNNVKVIISLGGWGHAEGFSPVAADSAKRVFFINNLINFIKKYNYDGVDFDWESPSTNADKKNLTLLIKELRTRFNTENPDWLITFAVGTGNWSGQWFNYSELIKYVDWFNAMCYDYHGSWSAHSGHNAPLYQPPGDQCGAVDVGMYYLNHIRGIPKKQLTVGMPFYGKEFNTSSLYSNFTGSVTDLYYYQIVPKINGDWTYHWDSVAKVPYLTNSTNTKLITFDDTVSIRLKCQWIKEQGYSGGMIWALGQDVIGNSQPLLETIGKHLIRTTGVSDSRSIVQRFILEQNYPNPFNPSTIISFKLKKPGYVRMDVYNISGKKVKTLINNFMQPGFHQVIFNAIDMPSGIYFYSLKSDGYNKIRSMMLIK